MFTFIQSSPLQVIFDPIRTEERLPSVAFDITANWMMPFQQAQIIIKESWFEYSVLNRFEIDLKQLSNRQIDRVMLCDMSLEPVIQKEMAIKLLLNLDQLIPQEWEHF